MWCEVLKNRRVQRLDVYCGIMNKCDKNVILNIARRKIEKTGMSQLLSKKGL